MHAIFKDERDRILDSVTGVPLDDADSWLSLRPDAVRCVVYDDDDRVRGAIVAVFAREDVTDRWRREVAPAEEGGPRVAAVR